MQIVFGSDGFRGVIGHTFTRDTVARIVLAGCAYIRETSPDHVGCTIPVGYDTRFLSEEIATYVARVLAATGFCSELTARPCTSPYLSFATHHVGVPLGVMVTASHNPYMYGGIKLKGGHGGSLFARDAELVEQLATMVDTTPVAELKLIDRAATVKHFDVEKQYRRAIIEAAGWGGSSEQKLIVDYMHGAAAGIYGDILDAVCDVNTALRTEPDPLFSGAKPEPMPALLKELALRVAHDGNDTIGLAFDGDGDRLAVVDEAGCFLGPHETFSLLLKHIVTVQGRHGPAITSVSLSSMGRSVAESLGCRVTEVPVGFKNISREMMHQDAIIGGEESGGTAIGHFLPERDALLMAMLLLAAKHHAQATIHEMVEELYAEYGKPVFIRRDVQFNEQITHSELTARIRELASLTHIVDEEIISLNHRDGMKLNTAAGWVLVRPSGTEPLLRVYAETASTEQTEAYIASVLATLGITG